MGGRRVHVNALLLRVSLSPQKKLGLQMKKFYPFDRDWIGQLPSAPNSGDSRVAGGPKRRRSLQLQGNSEWKRRISSSTTRPYFERNSSPEGEPWGRIIIKQFLPEKSYKKRGWRFLSFRRQAASTATKQRHCLPAKVSGPWLSPDGDIFSSIISLSISPLQLFLNLGKKR